MKILFDFSVINACDSLPCINGATCKNIGTSYTCTCASGWDGVNCEKPDMTGCPPNKPKVNCDVNPCDGKTCTKYPYAKCEPDYCGGCNYNFIWKGKKLKSHKCGRNKPGCQVGQNDGNKGNGKGNDPSCKDQNGAPEPMESAPTPPSGKKSSGSSSSEEDRWNVPSGVWNRHEGRGSSSEEDRWNVPSGVWNRHEGRGSSSEEDRSNVRKRHGRPSGVRNTAGGGSSSEEDRSNEYCRWRI
ncbi:uncharacterized protein [Amphiura filiformis]|uniref:uncharacterized protein n=1 Tax=Amphiura filiformis TaxID=82378 RepID=UPI003B2256E3